MEKFFLLIKLLFIPILLWLGFFFNEKAFDLVESIRKWERIPHIPAEYIVPGIVHTGGTAESDGKTISAPHSQTKTLAYNYQLYRILRKNNEEKRRDLIKSEKLSVPFYLRDESGLIKIEPNSDCLELKEKYSKMVSEKETDREDRSLMQKGLELLQSSSDEEIFYLHKESRLDVGNKVFLVGNAVAEGSEILVRFHAESEWSPKFRLSFFSEDETREVYGFLGISALALGLGCLSFAIYLVLNLLKVHKTFVYLSSLGFVIISTLGLQSFFMIEKDILGALYLYENQVQERGKVVERMHPNWDGNWDTQVGSLLEVKDGQLQEKIKNHKLILARYESRLNSMLDGLLEKFVLRQMDVVLPDPLPMSPEEKNSFATIEEGFVQTRLSWMYSGILGLVGFVFTGVFTRKGLKGITDKRWIEKLPFVKIGSVVYGLNKIRGKVYMKENRAFISPLTNERCFYYSHEGWEKSGSENTYKVLGRKLTKFYAKDEGGMIPVNPQYSKIFVKETLGPWKDEKGNSQYLKRITQDSEVTILGYAEIDPKTHDRLIMKRDENFPMVISEKDDLGVMQSQSRSAFWRLSFGMNGFSLLVLAGLGYFGNVGVLSFQMASLAPIGYMLLVMIVMLYNDMVFLRQRCDAMFANIDVAIRKKIDLLDNITEIASAYMKQEDWIQNELAGLRKQSDKAMSKNVNRTLRSFINPKLMLLNAFFQKFFMSTENYPELKGSEVIADLHKKITDLDNDIAFMREGYNRAVKVYNTRIQKFPELVFAKIFFFRKQEFIEVEG